jgi:hypothetical protein
MSLTGIQLSSGVITGAGKPIDAKYGPYSSTAAAILNVPAYLRYKGLTVGILVSGSVVDYWWKDGTSDVDLVVKTAGASGTDDFVESTTIDFVVQLTQAEYDALPSYDINTLYVIVE